MKFNEIVSYIIERRKSLGVSQRELAELSGVSLHTLCNFESGKGNPTVTVMFKIAETLGVQITAGVNRI